MILTLALTKDKLERYFFFYLEECGVVEQLVKQNLHLIL